MLSDVIEHCHAEFMLTVVYTEGHNPEQYVKFHNAECHYADSRYAECRY